MDVKDIDLQVLGEGGTERRRLKLLLSYLIAGACLGWVLFHLHPRQLLHDAIHLDWPLVLFAMGIFNFSYLFQGARWKMLLRPVARVGILETTQAIYVGLFMNEIVPLRFGELARAYLISRWNSCRFVEIVPSMVVERLLDGAWLALGVGIATLLLPLPPYLVRGAQIFGGIILALAALVLYAVFREEDALEHGTVLPVRRKLPGRISFFIRELATGLRRIGISRYFFLAVAATLASLFVEILSFWLVIQAYGFPLKFWQGAIVVLIVHIGIVLPTAPANIGTYQFFVAVGLELFGVNRASATGFSLVVFVILAIPLWVIGFIALSRSGMSLSSLRRQAANAIREKP